MQRFAYIGTLISLELTERCHKVDDRRRINMLRRQLLLLLTLVVGSLAISPFPELQEEFADHSRDVEPQLKEFRQDNNEVRLDLIHWIIREIGNLTIEMRRITDETWEIIENHEDTDEYCLEDLRYLFDYYVWIGELDIMYCADDMDWYMRYDATYRFNPRVSFMQRENSRAIYQTVQSLGRNQFLDNMGDTVDELHEELDYYRNLWTGYQEVLREEIEAMEPFAEAVQGEMYWWQDYAIDWHKLFMQWAIEDIEYYCGDFRKV